MNDFSAFLAESQRRIEAQLAGVLPAPPEGEGAVLFAAINYSLLAGGKRLRPTLFLATLALFEHEDEGLLPFAAALEMIHTYSLIHDDLPAMDNDDFRRGKPTCHKVYGEAQAILAGDGLLTQAFTVMCSVRQAVAAEPLLAAIEEVSRSAGLEGMVLGQVVDIAYQGKPLNLPQLQDIHAHKTGALFRAAILSAAILAGAGEAEQQALSEYSKQMGLIFQATDDLLDIVGDVDKLGKPLGSDARNAKTTYPVLLGVDGAKAAIATAAAAAEQALAPFGARAALLRGCIDYFVHRDF